MSNINIILEKRKKVGLTQDEIAALLDIDRSTVSKWETGEFLPGTKTLIRLAELYDCTTDELLGRSKVKM